LFLSRLVQNLLVTMGDSETVVAQTSAVMGYTSAGYSSTDYANISSNVSLDDGAFADGASGALAASAAVADPANAVIDGSNACGEESYNMDLNSAMQGAPATMHYDSEPTYGGADTDENLMGLTNISVGSSQVALLTDISENGNPSVDVDGSSNHKLADSSALSAEEERLWSIVRANSLDFNAWTSLIEEAEKMAEASQLDFQMFNKN
ncbi:hypothetical protein U1Q18_041016, partial [Sarracenia purpurea var. burkii]